MKKFRVVISCDDSDYVRFLPLISAAYRKFYDCVLTLGFVTDKTRKECEDRFGKYVDALQVFPRIKGYHQIALAKMVSTWMLCQFGGELVMIGDMDRIPLSPKFLQVLADSHASGTISCTGKEYYTGELNGKIPMCYTFAESNVWRELVSPASSFSEFVAENSNTKKLFDKKEDALKSADKFSDESLVRVFLAKRKMLNIVRNTPRLWTTLENTIDRKRWEIDPKRLKGGSYVECHSIRPTVKNMPRFKPLFDYFGVSPI